MSDSLTADTAGLPLTVPSIEKRECALCGLRVGRSGMRQVVGEESLEFCCPGCSAVFQILFNRPEALPSNYRETELFRACVEAGVIPRNEEDLARRGIQEIESAEEGGQLRSLTAAEHAQDLLLCLDGMWCPACAWLIEDVLRRTKGVLEARVFFLSDMAEVKYLPQFLSPGASRCTSFESPSATRTRSMSFTPVPSKGGFAG